MTQRVTQRVMGCVIALAVTLVAVGACRGGGAPSRQLTVFAASSLTDAFSRLGKEFEQRHRDVDVVFSFASSSSLAQQTVRGAPADVFAAADTRTMRMVTDAGLAPPDAPVFARNRLQIAVPAGNPGNVETLRDLERPELTVALCAEQVPCGVATRRALGAAGVRAVVDTYERDVKAALTKVTLNEVDVALVYRSDVRAAGDRAVGKDFPEAAHAVNSYPIAVLNDAPKRDAARAFVGYVRSARGSEVLLEAGFEAP